MMVDCTLVVGKVVSSQSVTVGTDGCIAFADRQLRVRLLLVLLSGGQSAIITF